MEWYYADGDEQRGPVTESVLAGLVEQGVVRADTLVWNASMSDWRPYSEVQAQSDPMRTNDTVATGAPPTPMTEEYTEPLAIVSLVFSIISCGCGCFAAIPAVIFGHIALNKINEAGGRIAGRPLALAGLVIGYTMLVITVIGMFLNVFLAFVGAAG
jgi:hypothetical protein